MVCDQPQPSGNRYNPSGFRNWVKTPAQPALPAQQSLGTTFVCVRSPAKPQLRLSATFGANNGLISRVIWCAHHPSQHTHTHTHGEINGNLCPVLHYLCANFGWQNKNRLAQRQKLLHVPRPHPPFALPFSWGYFLRPRTFTHRSGARAAGLLS